MHHIKKIFMVTLCFSGLIFSGSGTNEKKSLSQEVNSIEQEYIAIINSSNLETQKKLQMLSVLKFKAKNILENNPAITEKLLLLASTILIPINTYFHLKLNEENNNLTDIYNTTEQKNNPSALEEDAKKIEDFKKKYSAFYKNLDCDQCHSTNNDTLSFQIKEIQQILENDHNQFFCAPNLKRKILNLLSNKIFNMKNTCKNDPSCQIKKLQNFIENKISENKELIETCYGGYMIIGILTGYSLYNLFNISHQKNRLIKLIENIENLELSLTHKN